MISPERGSTHGLIHPVSSLGSLYLTDSRISYRTAYFRARQDYYISVFLFKNLQPVFASLPASPLAPTIRWVGISGGLSRPHEHSHSVTVVCLSQACGAEGDWTIHTYCVQGTVGAPWGPVAAAQM